MKQHEFDRISLAFGLVTLAAGVVIIGQQAGVWRPDPRNLAAFGVIAAALTLAAMWPRGRRVGSDPVSHSPGSAINRLPDLRSLAEPPSRAAAPPSRPSVGVSDNGPVSVARTAEAPPDTSGPSTEAD